MFLSFLSFYTGLCPRIDRPLGLHDYPFLLAFACLELYTIAQLCYYAICNRCFLPISHFAVGVMALYFATNLAVILICLPVLIFLLLVYNLLQLRFVFVRRGRVVYLAVFPGPCLQLSEGLLISGRFVDCELRSRLKQYRFSCHGQLVVGDRCSY